MKQNPVLRKDEVTGVRVLGDNLRDDFPIFSRKVHGKRLAYLDNAATTQKPECVIDCLTSYYKQMNANIHRGIYKLAEEATAAYEATRVIVAGLIGARKENIIFTRNTTEAINVVMLGWAQYHLNPGDEILLTEMEHHSNLVPWIMLAKRKGFILRYISVTDKGELDLNNLHLLINQRTKLVSLTHVSNVLGTINPVGRIIEEAHRVGARVLIDGAQSIPHLTVDVKELDCDFLAFSAHKMLGPTGVGILYGKMDVLEAMEPVYGGGEMIERVSLESVTYNEIPWRFEAGTQNIADIVAFKPAIEYLKKLDHRKIREHELKLMGPMMDGLMKLGFDILGPLDLSVRVGVISFTAPMVHPHDIATILDQFGVAIRAGHHCAQPLMRRFGVNATARLSFYIYNDMDDINVLIEGLKEARSYFG